MHDGRLEVDPSRRHIVITGGAGYIGSMLCSELLKRGEWVTIVDSLMFGGDSLLAYAHVPKFHFLQADVCEPGVVVQAARGARERGFPEVSAVIHLAAMVGFPACRDAGREKVWKVNVEAVQNALDDAEHLGAERFIFSSTYSVYGWADGEQAVSEDSPLNPQSLYGESKIAGETLLLEQAQDASCSPLIFRFATLYGVSPRMRFDLIVNQFVLEAYAQKELRLYQAGYSRAFIHVQDVVRGLLLGLDAPEAKARGEIYNLGDDESNHTKEEIVGFIKAALPETRIQYEKVSFREDMRDVSVSFSKVRQALSFRQRWTVPQGIQEVLTLLETGLLGDPFAVRYRNAPPILP
jgi:nucleoside-diphosphate-sugar epimerase